MAETTPRSTPPSGEGQDESVRKIEQEYERQRQEGDDPDEEARLMQGAFRHGHTAEPAKVAEEEAESAEREERSSNR